MDVGDEGYSDEKRKRVLNEEDEDGKIIISISERMWGRRDGGTGIIDFENVWFKASVSWRHVAWGLQVNLTFSLNWTTYIPLVILPYSSRHLFKN